MSRPITFPKRGTLGEWVNHETGVMIQKQTDGSYRPFRPADTTGGYIGISVAKRTLAEAKAEAARYIDGSLRHQMGVAYAEAVAEHAARAADAAEAAGAPTWRAAAARRMIGYAIEGHPRWLASAINEVRRLEEWTAEYARMAEDAERVPASAALIHLHKRYSGSWTVCGNDEVPVSETTERLAKTTCPRCIHDGDRVPRTRALNIEQAHAEALQIDRGYPSGQSRTWHEACYRRAVEIDAAAPNMSIATESLIDEAHAEASTMEVERIKQEFRDALAAKRAPAHLETGAPADLDDDAAWAEYCAALPEPTDAELAAVLTEYANPYADQIASCHEGFRTHARLLWQKRAGHGSPFSFAYLRDAMRTYAECGRVYRTLGEAAAYATLSRMHLAASVEGADAASVTFGPVA